MAETMPNVEGTAGSLIVQVEGDIHIDAALVSRSVYVTGYKSTAEPEDLMIHFMKRKNGGGNIDSIVISKRGAAVITFDSPEDVKTVLQKKQELEGAALNVKPYEEIMKTDNHSLVTDMTEEPVDAFVNTANDVFQQAGDIKQTQQNSSEMLDIDDFNTVDVSSFEIEPTFMKFLEQAYKNKLREIEEAHGVKIIRNENATQVQIHSSEILNNPHSYQEGCDAFIDLYQKLFPNVSLEVIDLKSADDKALIIEAIKAIESEYPVIIEMRRDNKLQVFGERNNITSSVQALKEKLGSLQGGSRKTRHSQRNTNLSAREPQTSQEDRFSVLQQLLIHGVKFSLYQRDITDERVDAIVNAANHVLQHDGGVAAAIVRKGGRQIEEESRQIMLHRNNRPLNEGDAVYTKGGNLSCRYVIHTVSPRWNDHYRQRNISLLRRACMESLCLAAELKLSSIALPAISSGILGTPKSICAQVMFQAVEEFSSNTDPKFSTLRDVRIAIIDDETINVFREEFVKRYTYQETSPSTKGSPLKERSEVSNVAPSAKPLSGRGRGICATSFYGRPYEEVGSKPSGSIQLANTGGTKSANAVRGRGIKYASINAVMTIGRN